MSSHVLTICFCLILHAAYCQSSIDSLKALLASESHSESIVNVHNELAWQYRLKDLSLAKHHAKLAYSLAEQLQEERGLSDACMRLGVILKKAGSLDSALFFVHRALRLRRSLGDSILVAQSLTVLSAIYGKKAEYGRAINIERQALFLRLQNDSIGIAKSYNHLGQYYLELKNLDSSVACFNRGIRSCSEPEELSKLHTNLAVCWYELDSSRLAIQSQQLAINYEIETGDEEGLMASLANLVIMLSEFGDHEFAREALQGQIRNTNTNQWARFYSMAHYHLARLYLNEFEVDSARYYFLKSRKIGAFQYPSDNLEVSRNLLNIYVELGLSDSLANELHRFEELIRTVYKEDLAVETAIAETKFKTEEHKAKIQSQRSELLKSRLNIWATALSSIILFLVLALVVYYQRQRALIAQKDTLIKQQEVEELIKQQELSAMDAMMEGQEQERQRIAEDLHDRVGSQLAAVKLNMETLEGEVEKGRAENREQFNHTYGLLDNLVDEVRRISHNMVSGVLVKFGLEEALRELAGQLSASGQISVDVKAHNLEERMPSKMEITLYRVIQELLANVLKHAKASEVCISLNRLEGSLNVIVEDNGVGFDPDAVQRGMGLQNIEKRAATLQALLNIDSKKGRGTTVILDIPLH